MRAAVAKVTFTFADGFDGFFDSNRVQVVDRHGETLDNEIKVFPLLYPSNLESSLVQKLDGLEKAVHEDLGKQDYEPANALARALKNGTTELKAEDFWWTWIAKRLGLDVEGPLTAQSIVSALKARDVRILLTIDGIEDALQPTGILTKEQEDVLRALLQTTTNTIRDLRSPYLGIVTFIRRDIAQAAIHQNWGQFYRLHEEP